MAECWLILGASSPIARAFARQVAAEGARVVLAGRDREDLEAAAADLRVRHGAEVVVLDFDAGHCDSHQAFLGDAIAAAAGHSISVLAAFATMAEQQAVEDDPARAQYMIAVNYAGLVSLLLRLAPVLEVQGQGHVVVLGSVAGDRGRASNYVYGSTKAALRVFAEGLAVRLWRAGVTVTIPRLGFIDTGLTWGRSGVFLALSPERCAAACLRLARRGVLHGTVPWFWWPIMAVINALPWRVFRKLHI